MYGATRKATVLMLAIVLLAPATVVAQNDTAYEDEEEPEPDEPPEEEPAENETGDEPEEPGDEEEIGGNETDEDDPDDAIDDGDDEAEDREEEQEDEDEAEDEDEDEDEREERRRVEVDVEGEKAQFKLEREDAAGEQEVLLEYDAPGGELALEFERETNGTEEALEYTVDLERFLEYEDVNGNGVYDEDVDTLLASYPVDELRWTVGGVHDVQVGNDTAKSVVGLGEIPGTNGTFGVRLLAVGSFAQLESLQLLPTDIKVDFTWTDVPWTANTSRLALDLEVRTERSVELEDDEDDGNVPTLNATFGDVAAHFSWAEQAEVDGATVPVQSQVLQEEREEESEPGEVTQEVERTLLLNYPQGDRIVHDPVMGVRYAGQAAEEPEEPAPGADVPFPGAPLLVGLLALTAALLGVRRAHRRR